MEATISRRTFLKGGAAAACTLAAAGLPASIAAADTAPHLATLIEIDKCVGCESCVDACREANAAKYPVPVKPFPRMYPNRVKASDWSGKKGVRDRLTPYNWLYIQRAVVDVNGEKKEISMPRRCMHCSNPPCVKLCPWGAARQEKNGVSRIDSELCLGGAKCSSVCPWNIPQRQTGVGLYLDILPAFAGNGVMYKCDRCYDRLSEGKLPACIEACPEGVQSIGPREEIVEKANERAKEIGGFIYGEKENGGTNTLYVSSVPFDRLDAAIEKGSGKPHLRAAEDSMGQANNLTAALFLAPVAGIAAAVGRYYKTIRKEGNRNAS
ncbi:MAG: 4Fe-4S dicluster domain-containing protein [Desulfobacteraceae bacterium]|nr:MAG: 4Fe-4S dicluster domain-containing protein [Desulfobacteraceae bacterium]